MADRSSGMPMPGGYWLWPARMAAMAASATSGGPSVSGNPWPRLMAPVRTASADISANTVVRNSRIRSTRNGPSTSAPDLGSHLDQQPELGHFVVVGEHVALDGGREPALRRDAQLVEGHVLRRL